MINKFKRAQITTEYAVFVVALVVALSAMNVYVKRGFNARLKDAIDYPLKKPEANFTTSQYEPDYYFSSSLTNSTAKSEVSMTKGSAIDSSTEALTAFTMWEKINGTQ